MKQSLIQMINVKDLIVDQEYGSLLPQVPDDDFEKLEASILKEGVLHPFVINQDNIVLDGHTRLRICKLHSILQVPYVVHVSATKMDEAEFVLAFNLNRRHLSAQQKVEIGLHILKIEMAKAKQRQIETGTTVGVGHPKKHTQDIGESSGKARKDSESLLIAAKKVDMNSETLRKAYKIQKQSEVDEGTKRLWDDITSGGISVHDAYASLQEQERKGKMEMVQDTDNRYSIVNVNPPRYDCKELKTLVLPLKKDAVVWLWSSNQFLPSAFALLEFWGLQYRTMLTWVKGKRRKGGTQWLVDQTEHCLLATTGSPALKLTDQSSVLIATSASRRPRKPHEFYLLIDTLSEGNRINMFSPKGGEGDEP